jgi:hypothetical protein
MGSAARSGVRLTRHDFAMATDNPGTSADTPVSTALGVRDNARIGQRPDLPDNPNSNPDTHVSQ